jgi:non-ribosomal peptide synthetase component E (peptide arylation enzyme)
MHSSAKSQAKRGGEEVAAKKSIEEIVLPEPGITQAEHVCKKLYV